MRRYTREELHDLAAGYALGAATPEEAAAVEEVLPTTPELAAEVAAYRDVAVEIALARAVTPAPELRDQMMARIRATKVTPIAAPAPRRTASRWLAVGLAASVVAAAGLAWQNAQLRQSLDERQSALATVSEQAARRERQLETLLEAERQLYVAQMTGADTVKGPGIQLFWNARQGRAVLHAFRLRPAPAGRTYQLWLLVDGKPYSATVFNSDADGRALIENLTLPRSTSGVTQVLLTEEPAGGSPGPTTTPFLGGKLART